MPKQIAPMSDRAIQNLKHQGDPKYTYVKAVGGVGGLHIQVTYSGTKSWLLRLSIKGTGKRREVGLGPYPEVSLKDAREKATELRAQARQGIDPVQERQKKAEAAAKEAKSRISFEMVAEQYFQATVTDYDSPKRSERDKIVAVQRYAYPVIGSMPMPTIDVDNIEQIILPIWETKHITADRLRSTIESVFRYANAKKIHRGFNPAEWKGNLEFVLKKKADVHNPQSKPALAVSDAPTWFKRLQESPNTAAPALLLIALTGCRTGEILRAKWSELNGNILDIPAERMKKRKAHRVPLSTAALELIENQPRVDGTDLIFPSRTYTPMADARTSALMKEVHEAEEGPFLDPQTKKPAVPHGLRSTFRNWAHENDWEYNLAEMALAHDIGTAVTRAYLRTDMIEKRRSMMEAWSDHLHGVKAQDLDTLPNVLKLRA